MSEQPNGSEDSRLAPAVRVVIEGRGSQVGVQTNCAWQVAVNLMKDAMVALSQQAVREEAKTLVKPVGPIPPNGPVPPLRRLP